MNIVADESVDFAIVQLLRVKGISVTSISEESPGISDQEVLVIALGRKSLLITEDKDFGELTYRLRLKHRGILLIRLADVPRVQRIEIAVLAIERHYNDLFDNFSVLDSQGLRVKTSRVRLDEK